MQTTVVGDPIKSNGDPLLGRDPGVEKHWFKVNFIHRFLWIKSRNNTSATRWKSI